MKDKHIAITATGHFLPPEVITNEEIAESYNNFVNQYNEKRLSNNIVSENLLCSDSEFIFKASGIRKRHVLNKKAILDVGLMRPTISERENHEIAFQSEFGLKAAQSALSKIKRDANDIDGVIVACSNMQRAYPAIAIEIQNALGISGWAYDMNAACSSASFGIANAYSAIKAGIAKSVLVITPEMYTAHINFKDRKSHFIFGDGASAVLVEEVTTLNQGFKILGCQLQTRFSNSIRNDFGFLNRAEGCVDPFAPDKYFTQNGRKVREEVVPFVIDHINKHLRDLVVNHNDVKRLWLHQSNSHMNNNIAKGIIKNIETISQVPSILEECGNTGASGVVITFDKFKEDLASGDLGVICSFGAGYSVGSVVIKKF